MLLPFYILLNSKIVLSCFLRLKSACFEIKQHPKCLAISLVVLGCMLLLTIIITVASNSHHEPAKRTGNEPKWAKTEKGTQA